jgi:hypothetical protein
MDKDYSLRQKESITAFFSCIFGLVCIILGVWIYIYSATKIETAVFERLGADFLPRMTALVMIFLGVLLIIEQYRKIDRSLLQFNWDKIKSGLKESRYSIFLVFTFIVYTVVLPVIGFIPSTIMFLFASIVVMGKFRKKEFIAAIIKSLVIPAIIYYVLEVQLRIILP